MARNTKTDLKDQKFTFCDDVRDEVSGKLYKYTPKEKAFVLHYLTDANFTGTRAAKAAGYRCTTDGSFRQIAATMLQKPKIRAAIDRAFEALTMSKFETLHRLARIGAGDIADLLNDDNEFDLEIARERNTTFLLKKVHIKRTRREITKQSIDVPADADAELLESSIIDEEIRFEIHDPIKALELIGKAGRAFIERVESSGKDGKPLIPENAASVVVYLPDNGRGDADSDPDPAKAARTSGVSRKRS